MNEGDVLNQITLPNVCRCCLLTTGICDLRDSDPVIGNTSSKLAPADKILECYGITISHLFEEEASHSICASCLMQLNSAYSFRQQVLKCEDKYLQYFRKGCRSPKLEPTDNNCDFYYLDCATVSNDEAANAESKTEIDSEETNLVSANKKTKTRNAISNTVENSSEIALLVNKNQSIIKEPSGRAKKMRKTKRRTVKKGTRKGSDKSIVELNHNLNQVVIIDDMKNKNQSEENKEKAEQGTKECIPYVPIELEEISNESKSIINSSIDREVDLDLANGVQNSGELKTESQVLMPSGTKTISERRQVILTCEAVLKNTNACPFRHHKSWFQCFYCSEEFFEMTSLRNHITNNHRDVETELHKLKRYPRTLQIDISNLECKQCNLNLEDVETMQRHLKMEHGKVIYKEFIADYKVDVSPYFCHLCNAEFHVFRTLTTHLNEHYANCICDVCGRSFINSKRLIVHKRIHEKGNFPCDDCGKILNTKTSKANHMESVHSKRELKCQICFKAMKHYNDRVKHMSEMHNITHIFKCKICSKEYNVKHYLATHMRQTHGSKNKKCQECDMVFITNHGLKKHMSKHLGVKPHKCVECGKAYARSYTLREHMRVHECEKGFI